jgi:hypothetical protein
MAAKKFIRPYVLASPGHFFFAVLIAAGGTEALYIHKQVSALGWAGTALSWVLPVAVIVIVDGYIVRLLWIAACVSQGMEETWPRLPHRTTALALLVMNAPALILSFAGLYIETNAVTAGSKVLHTIADGIYFSTVTITTLGYGDFTPQDPLAKYIVVFELASGILLLVTALPLVVARLNRLDGDAADERGEKVGFHRLRISLPGRVDDELRIERNALTWRRFTFCLTVTKTDAGEFEYVVNGGAPVPIDAGKVFNIDRDGRISQN